MKTLATWLEDIQQIHPKEWDLGLERVGEVAMRLDVSKPAKTCILVAGTNGKGSTCEYLARLCESQGLSYGKTTSPFLNQYNEQFVLDGVNASDAQIIAAFEQIAAVSEDTSLTYFEYSALAALLIFKQQKVDVAILEIGLGGRLDAMNLVKPDLSIITRIALDHQDWLGDTREKIGLEKAGVMRQDMPVVVLDDDPPIALLQHAREIEADLHLVNQHFDYSSESLKLADKTFSLGATHLPLPSAVAAIVGLELLGFGLRQSDVDAALESARLPGRFQRLPGSPTIILDVCHNPDAAEYLAAQLAARNLHNLSIVAGVYKDKDCAGIFQNLAPFAAGWYFCDLGVERGASAAHLRDVLSDACGSTSETYAKVEDALGAAIRCTDSAGVVLVLGSFVTISSAMKFFQIDEKS